MPNYRRSSLGSTYFFTVVTESRAPILTSPLGITALRTAVKATRARFPFTLEAMVVLPDHLHCIWTLLDADVDYSTRWAFLKKTFTQHFLKGGGTEVDPRASKLRKRERGVWQRRFWEHTITSDERYSRLMDYIHFNPVKHGHAVCPIDYPFSSFKRCVERGFYARDWGCQRGVALEFDDVADVVGE